MTLLLGDLLTSIPFTTGLLLIVIPVLLVTVLLDANGFRHMISLEWGIGIVLFLGAVVSLLITGEFKGSLEFLYFGLFYTVWPILLAGVLFHSQIHPDKDVTAKYILYGWGTAHVTVALLQIGQFPFGKIIFHDTWPPFFGYTLLMLFLVPLVLFLASGMYHSSEFRELPS